MNITQTFNSMRLIGLFYEIKGKAVTVEYKLTKTEFHIVSFLVNNPTLNNAKAIEEYKKIPKASVSIALDSLIEKKLIVKKTDEKDRRVQHLHLTHKADKIKEVIKNLQIELNQIVMKGFTEEETKTFEDYTQRIFNNIEQNLKDL